MKYLRLIQSILLLIAIIINYHYFKGSLASVIISFCLGICVLINWYFEFKEKKQK